MPIYPVKFGQRGRGEQLSNAPKNQPGLLSVQNATNTDGAISKRPGCTIRALTRSDDPADLITNPRAISSRGNDVVIATDGELYSLQTCGLSGAGTAGTATPSEVASAIDAVEDRRSTEQSFDIPLPGSPVAGDARTRLGRPDIDPDVVITPSGRTITISAALTTITVTEGTRAVPVPLSGPAQRLIRMRAVVVPAQDRIHSGLPGFPAPVETDAVVVTWLSGNGSNAILNYTTIYVWKIEPFPQFFTILQAEGQDQIALATVLGSSSASSYEVDAASTAISVFSTAGPTLRVIEFESPLSSQAYTVTNPPGAAAGYAIDVEAEFFPGAGPLAVTWASYDDGVQHAVQLDPNSTTVISERSHIGLPLNDEVTQVAITGGPLVTWVLADTFTDAISPRPVWDFDPLVPDVKMVDLDGDDLRMSFEDIVSGPDFGLQRYTMENSASGSALYSPITVQGTMSGTVDAQWFRQNDTIYGAMTSDPSGLHEALWQRTAEVPSLVVNSSITSVAVSVFDDLPATPSADDRIVLTYWLSDTQLRVIRRNNIDSAALTQVIVVPEGVGVFGQVIGSTLLQHSLGNTVWMMIWTWLPTGEVLTVSTTSASPPLDITFTRVDSFTETPAFASGFATIPSTDRGLLSVSYNSESIEVYEVTGTLFVRVSPALGVRAGGNWVSRGRWTRTQLSSDVVRHHGTEDAVSADAATILNDDGEPCTFVASEVTGGGALFDVMTTHNEAQGVIDATGKRPRVSQHSDDSLFLGYEDSTGQLVYGVWSPGSPLSFTPSGFTLLAERAWDQTGAEIPAEAFGVWASVDDDQGAEFINLRVWPDVSTPSSTFHGTGVEVALDCAVSARVINDTEVEISWAVCGTSAPSLNLVRVGVTTIDVDTGGVTVGFAETISLPGGANVRPMAVSVDSRDGVMIECWVEVEGPINRHIETFIVETGKVTPDGYFKRAALVSQLAPLHGSAVGAISLLGTSSDDDDVTDDTFVGGQAYRDGILLVSATTSEVVGRVSVGLVEDFASRLVRVPKTGLNLGPDGRLDLGWQETDLDIGTTRAPTLVRYAWSPDSSAHEPAVLDAIMVGAHGGYPRMYDGRIVNEHDWHELPEIVLIATPAAGTALLAGEYNVAITYESYDSTGKLYRSRPTFAGKITLAAGDALNVTTRDLSITERDDVRTVLWRTTEQTASNADPRFYRETEALATLPAGVNSTLISLSLDDVSLVEREALDQGDLPGDVLPSDPIEITDFTAQVDGRIWGVAPRQPNSAYYTVAAPSAEGPPRGAHWSLVQIVTHDGSGKLTAIVQMGSRVGLLTGLGGSGIYTPGPDATGAGSYSQPERLNMSIGPSSHAGIAKIPEGIVFVPARRAPVQLLSAGWTAVDLGDEIADPFERGVQVPIALAYVQSTNAVHVLETLSAATHQLQLDSRAWETDTKRAGLDLTVKDDGVLVILSPTLGALFEDESVFSSGGVGYVTSVRLPWFLTDGRPELEGNLVEVRIQGQYRGAHDLTIRVRINFREQVVRELTVSAADLAQHFADGEEYVYYYRPAQKCTAASVEVSDDGLPNESFAIESIIVSTEPTSTGGSPVLRSLPSSHAFVTQT